MIDQDEFAPALFLQRENHSYEVSLSEFAAGEELSDERDLQGGGYTWQALIKYLVRTRAPQIVDQIDYGSEGDTFVSFSSSLEAIRAVGRLVQSATRDPELLREAFDKADPDELE